jgi:hypothetical protein
MADVHDYNQPGRDDPGHFVVTTALSPNLAPISATLEHEPTPPNFILKLQAALAR